MFTSTSAWSRLSRFAVAGTMMVSILSFSFAPIAYAEEASPNEPLTEEPKLPEEPKVVDPAPADPPADPLPPAEPGAGETGDGDTTETFTIAASAGDNGSISPDGDTAVDEGADQEFIITPDIGYVVSDVVVDGNSEGAIDSYTFTAVDAAHSISVTFEKGAEEGSVAPQMLAKVKEKPNGCSIISDEMTQVDGHPASVLTFIHGLWTNAIKASSGAKWIWSEDGISDPTVDTTKVFTRKIYVSGEPVEAKIKFAADNGYIIKVNGDVVEDKIDTEFNYQNPITIQIGDYIEADAINTFEITVKNIGQDTPPENNPAGLTFNITINGSDCEEPEQEDEVTIVATKIVCDSEADLPNWANTSKDITSTTASELLTDSEGNCHLEPGWEFQWGDQTALNPGDSYVGEDDDYTTFGPTDADGTATTTVSIEGITEIRLREVLQEGYIPFTNQATPDDSDKVSAEFYCSTDVVHYDNYDFIYGPEAGETYHCLAINALEEPEVVQTSTVTMCKVDGNGNELGGWNLTLTGAHVENLVVPVNTSAGINTVNALTAGTSYVAAALGTWLNQGGVNPVDTEYSTTDGWTTHMDGYDGYQTDILELQINQAFDPNSDWGPYNSTHSYAQSFIPSSSGSSNFRIFDGSVTTQNESWFGDNSGELTVSLNKGYAGITDEETGCVVFKDVPYGTYETGETPQDGWHNVDGLDEVVVDEPEMTFTVVNDVNDSVGTIIINKYACEEGTTVTRDANGVGGTVPATCEPQAGATFGYTFDTTKTSPDTSGPYPGLTDSTPFQPFALTDVNGVSTNTNMSTEGRYLIVETSTGGTQLPAGDILGLYCTGDGDTSGTNDNQEITYIPGNGGTTNCVAYNKAPVTPPTQQIKVHIYKYLEDDENVATQIPNESSIAPFAMTSTWTAANLNGGVESSGSYVLGNNEGGTSLKYAADTSFMDAGADYTTSEVTGENGVIPVGGQCVEGEYRLVGYKTGSSVDNALAAGLTTAAPELTNITSDQTIIVINEDCDDVLDDGENPEPTSNTIVVRAGDLATDIADAFLTPDDWFFWNDENDTLNNALGSFVTGPVIAADAPAGTGSAQMTVTGTQRRNLATYQFKNVKLSDIDTLSFSTYSQSTGNGSPASERSPYLNFNVDFNNSDTWQNRLVYLPSINGAVVNDSWQSWDAINGGNAMWLFSGGNWPAGAVSNGSILGTTARSWNDILADYPNAETRSTDSWLGFRVGEPYADGFTGNVDEFVIRINNGVTDTTTTFDFEPDVITNTSETVVVKPSDLDGWAFNSDRDVWTTGVGDFVSGPAAAPLNSGSAHLTTPNTDDRNKLRKYLVAGTQISDITELKYSTYRASPDGGVLALALQFDVDMDSTPVLPGKADGRIVYEPYYTHAVNDDVWQQWDALDNAGTGNWWIAGPNGGASCTIANPCTWTELNTNYPDLQISADSLENTIDTDGAVFFKAGGSWAGFDGNVDEFIFGLKTGSNIHTITYDFEPEDTDAESENTSGGGGGGGTTSFAGRNGRVLGATTDEGTVAGTSCDWLLNTYMRKGWASNVYEEVIDLQAFLNRELGLSNPVTGYFGDVTEAAVKTFQLKYASDVLVPWIGIPGSGITSATTATGYVYKTTQWKINMINCPELNLPAPELP